MQRATRLAVGVLPAVMHGSEGTQERIIREVEDPVSSKRRDVIGIIKPGGVDDMHAKGRVTDRQKEAADRFLMIYETAHSDGMKGIDYSKLRVDGMTSGDVFGGEMIVRAIKELVRVRSVVGDAAYGLLVKVIAEGRSLRSVAREEIAAAGQGNESRRTTSFGVRLVKGLDALDRLWNTAVGAGNGIRSEGGEPGRVEVELKTIRVEATTIDGVKFVQAVDKIKEAVAKKKRAP